MPSLAATGPASSPKGAQWRVTPAGAAAALAILALAIGFNRVGVRPLWLDEAYSAWFSSRGWHELWTVVPTYETHPPLYYSLLKLWTTVAGSSPIALRSLSVLLGSATVLVTAAAALELDRQDRVHRPLLRLSTAGFLCACSPMLVSLGQQARPYALMTFAYALATLGLVRLLREFREGAGTVRSWTLLAVGTELTLWSHSLGVLYAVALAIALAPAWLRRPLDRGRLARGIAAALAVAALYLPCLLMIAGRAGDWHSTWMTWDNFNLVVLLVLCVAPIGEFGIASIVPAVILALLSKRAVEAAWLRNGWTPGRALLVLWWAPPLLSVAVSLLYFPVFLPRTLGAALVPAYLALAGPLARTDSARERKLLLAGLALLFPAAIIQTLQPSTERWDEVNAYLERSIRPGDELWLYPNDSALPVARNGGESLAMRGIPGDYPALGAKGPIRAGSPAVPSVTPAEAVAIARSAELDPPGTIWLLSRQSSIFDPDGVMPRALAEHRRPGKPRSWGYIVVQPFYRR